ncbi:hypothetical protein EKA14_04505 [Bacillus mycoides]|nr:hypothetical protein EKA14_04505 [Bacillus mycoides]
MKKLIGTLAITTSLFVLSSCSGREDKLIGNWHYEGDSYMVFKKEGSELVLTVTNGGVCFDLNQKVIKTDGDTIETEITSAKNKGEQADVGTNMIYTIKDDELTVTQRIDGETIEPRTYTKSKEGPANCGK